jgi:hypothetical protein
MFPSHYIPAAMEDFNIWFFAYSTSFWNKFILDKNLSIAKNLQYIPAFARVQAEFVFPR